MTGGSLVAREAHFRGQQALFEELIYLMRSNNVPKKNGQVDQCLYWRISSYLSRITLRKVITDEKRHVRGREMYEWYTSCSFEKKRLSTIAEQGG